MRYKIALAAALLATPALADGYVEPPIGPILTAPVPFYACTTEAAIRTAHENYNEKQCRFYAPGTAISFIEILDAAEIVLEDGTHVIAHYYHATVPVRNTPESWVVFLEQVPVASRVSAGL